MIKNILISIVFSALIFTDEYNYSLEDLNSTSSSFGLNVWEPYYLDYITMHYFGSQGWAGWTNTFGQLSNFQDELRNDDGYENVVIIAIGQTNISSFNSNFCANSDLPLVMDQYPGLPIREQFSPYGQHKYLVILDYDGNMIGNVELTSGVSFSSKQYIRSILEDHYDQLILGDVNNDSTINIQDIILLVNLILVGDTQPNADMNSDGIVNVLDIIQVVNIILS